MDRTLREIGEELGVSTILEGSVRREGRQVKVTLHLPATHRTSGVRTVILAR